ncbi:DUF6271 family protein [Kitasatospora sp. NBC_01560]
MRRICLALPANRACTATISAIGTEAAHAAEGSTPDAPATGGTE